MSDERRSGFLGATARAAGRRFAAAKRAYSRGQERTDAEGPYDEHARIVCRRHAERRAVALDAEGRPACYDPEHPDCRGCHEDIREGCIDTW